MELSRHEYIDKDFKDLRRFAALQESLEAWERLFVLKGLQETPVIEQFPGFGSLRIYKGRVVALRENIGKSKGYRVIFRLIEEGRCKILVFSRHGVYSSEKELISIIKSRI